jgi:hypothetical protein
MAECEDADSIPGLVPIHTWNPDCTSIAGTGAQWLANSSLSVTGAVSSLRSEDVAKEHALASLCQLLRVGGNQASEEALALGAVELSVSEVRAGLPSHCGEAFGAAPLLAMETLWYLLDDFHSCSRFREAGGHDLILNIVRDEGPRDAAVTCASLRLLSESLYSEPGCAALCTTDQLDFLVDALMWACKAEVAGQRLPDAVSGVSLVSHLCDVAALWVLRASGLGALCTRKLVLAIPLLLQAMAAGMEDAKLLQHGSRLLAALARTCQWPESLSQSVVAALSELCAPVHPEVSIYSGVALKAVQVQVQALHVDSLNSLD